MKNLDRIPERYVHLRFDTDHRFYVNPLAKVTNHDCLIIMLNWIEKNNVLYNAHKTVFIMSTFRLENNHSTWYVDCNTYLYLYLWVIKILKGRQIICILSNVLWKATSLRYNINKAIPRDGLTEWLINWKHNKRFITFICNYLREAKLKR